MADTQTTQDPQKFTAEKLERVEALLADLKEQAQAAHKAGDLYMLSVYNDLLAVASPVVNKAHARITREDQAVLNKAEKDARKAAHERKKAAKQHTTA